MQRSFQNMQLMFTHTQHTFNTAQRIPRTLFAFLPPKAPAEARKTLPTLIHVTKFKECAAKQKVSPAGRNTTPSPTNLRQVTDCPFGF